MVDVFEYDAELKFKCHDGTVRACREKIVTFGTGDFCARGAITVGGKVDTNLFDIGINGYRGKVTGKTTGKAGLDKYTIEFDLTDTGPDLFKTGYNMARVLDKLPALWQVAVK